MDLYRKYSLLVSDGCLDPFDLDELKKILDCMAIYRNDYMLRGRRENIEPCCLLIQALIMYPKKYSQTFVANFLILSVSSGYIELRTLIQIINSNYIFETVDGKYSELEFDLLKTIFVAVKNYLNNEEKNNFLDIYINYKEFDEIMLFIKDIIDRGGSSVINYFVEDFKALLHCFQDVGRALPFRWIYPVRRPEIENKSMSTNSLFYIDDVIIASMIETTTRMFKYPGLYDANDKKKLWIECRACEKLEKNYQSMVLFYTKLFSGEYRKIDTKLTRENLSSNLVLRILSFLGLNGVDYELQQGHF